MVSRICGILILVVACVTGAVAQDSPIRWRTIVKMTSPDEGTITVKALVGQGWHLYGTDLPKGGPKPTSFDFSGTTGIELIGAPVPSSKPVVKEDRQFGSRLSQWEQNVNFVQKFRLKKNVSERIVRLSIQYMGCNDATCLPPRTENFSAKVPDYKK
ncbi:MAG: protein-disulfide reductase DsbD N-terminal domain-containing protein [Muribaculaceae bacterium]|nr:protein-disulfide reductase DsbD N-terminal domain-containing protein [Muribaculaceae bacterium]